MKMKMKTRARTTELLDQAKVRDALSRVEPMARGAVRGATSAMLAAREVVKDVRGRAPSSDDVLRGLGLQRRTSVRLGLAWWPMLLGAALGATLLFFFDPDAGRRRRAMTRDRAQAFARDLGRRVQRARRYAASKSAGMTRAAQTLGLREPSPNDAALIDRVMSEAFRGQSDGLRGKVDLDAVGGVVFIRGEVPTPEEIASIEARVRRVPGVRDVENLMHLPGTPAPAAS